MESSQLAGRKSVEPATGRTSDLAFFQLSIGICLGFGICNFAAQAAYVSISRDKWAIFVLLYQIYYTTAVLLRLG